jgi:hypothetical protein
MNREKLIEGIEVEIESLELMFTDINKFPAFLGSREITNYDKAAIALMLSQFYNGIENILKRILDFNSIKLSPNEQYHIEIINSFSENNENNLPILFSNEIIEGFSILRRFRHYVFHGYSFRLEWDRLLLAIDSLPVLFQTFKSNIFSYKKKLSEEITD